MSLQLDGITQSCMGQDQHSKTHTNRPLALDPWKWQKDERSDGKKNYEIPKKSFQQKHLIIVSGQSKHDKELNSVVTLRGENHSQTIGSAPS
jgi:hypothetical protein